VVFFGCFNTSTTATTSLTSKCELGLLGCIARWGVSFPRYQQWGGAKLTLRPVQLFSLLLGQHVTSLPCLPPPNNNEGWPPRCVDRAVCGRHATLFAFLYFLTHKLCYYCYWYCY